MNCLKCGTENKQGAKFCVKCGESLIEVEASDVAEMKNPEINVVPEKVEENATETKETKKGIKGILVAISVAAVAVLLVCTLLLKSNTGYTPVENSIMPMYSPSDDKTLFSYNGSMLKDSLAGEWGEKTIFNLDKSVLLISYLDGNDIAWAIVNKNGVTKIVDSARRQALLSDDGKYVFYLSDDNIYSYSVADKKSTKIDSFEDYVLNSWTISANGKAILYVLYDSSENEYRTYANISGKKYDLGDDFVRAMGISNDGKYIYVRDDEKKLYLVNTKGEKNKIATSVDSVIFNNTNDEVLCNSDGNSYLSVKGNEKQKLFSGSVVDMTPLIDREHIGAGVYIASNNGEYVIYYVNSKKESEKLVSGIGGYKVSENRKKVYYTKSDSLYCIDAKSGAEPEKIGKNVSDYACDSNGKFAYYLNNKEELYYVKEGKEAVLVAEDVDGISEISAAGILFYIADDDLYSSVNGKKGTKIVSDCSDVHVVGKYVYYIDNEGKEDGEEVYDVYVSDNGGKKFKALAKEVN